VKPREIRFVKMLVDGGIISAEEVAHLDAARKQRLSAAAEPEPIWEVAISEGFITLAQAERFLTRLDQAIATATVIEPGEQDATEAEARKPAPTVSQAVKTSAQGGMKLGGYVLQSKLGQGGMGAVYKAHQESMDRSVAIKILPRTLAKNQEFISRFLREARAAGKLSHPNIVAGIDAGFADGYYYFAMEYVEGVNLGERLEEGPLEEEEVIRVGRQMAEGLDHAHAEGIVHRDVKPENILVTPDGEAKLCDLGLARSAGDDMRITQAGMAVGTPYYISPEQVRGKDPDARSDVYSLGASLYHLATGIPPFDGDNAMAIMHKHLNETPLRPTDLRPDGVSRALEAVIARMMARDIEDRYQDMKEVEEDLAKVASGEVPAALKGAVADRRRAGTKSTKVTGRGTGRGTARGGRAVGRRTTRARAQAVDGRRGFPLKLVAVGGVLLLLAGIASLVMFKSSATPEVGNRDRDGIHADPRKALLAGLTDELEKIRYYDKTRPKDYGRLITRYSNFLVKARGTELEKRAREALIAVKNRRNEDISVERLEKLAARLAKISAFERANPEEYKGALSRYATLLAGAAGTRFESQVKSAMSVTAGRRSAKANALLVTTRRDAETLQREGSFGKALARAGTFPPKYAVAVKQELAELRRAISSAGIKRWETILAEARGLATAKKFAVAKRKAAEGRKLGLIAVDTAVSQALASIEASRLAEHDQIARASRRKYDQFRTEYARLVAAGEFAAALKKGAELKGKLSPQLASRLAADLSLAESAGRCITDLRKRLKAARSGAFTTRLPGIGIAGRFMSYDAANGVEFKFGPNRTTVQLADFKGRSFLGLARGAAGGAFTPADARSAACYLLLSGSSAGVTELVASARAGGQKVADLQARLEVIVKGAREVEAEGLLASFEKLYAAKSWQAAALTGRRLLDEFADSAAVKARKDLRVLVGNARHAGSPLRTYTVMLQEGQPVAIAGVKAYRGTKTSFIVNFGKHADAPHDGNMLMRSGGRTFPLVAFAITRREGGPLPNDVEILEAQLLVCKPGGYTPYLLLRPMLSNWTEAEVTWNSASATAKWKTPGGDMAEKPVAVCDMPALFGAAPKDKRTVMWSGPWWCEFDVGAGLRAAVKARRNFGWRVGTYANAEKRPHVNMVQFAGRLTDQIANRPKLVLKIRCRGLKGKSLPVAGPGVKLVLQDGLSVAGRAYSGTRDASLNTWGVAAKANFGTGQELGHGLLKFAIFRSEGGPVPAGAVITAATLQLYKTNTYPAAVQLHEVLKPWKELEATGNGPLKGGKWTGLGCAGAGSDRSERIAAELRTPWRDGWVKLDVLESLQAWARRRRTNHGWLISSATKRAAAGLKFHSREHKQEPTRRPKLLIEYRLPGKR
jgi:eukaryotic-like serine/threonine-protein kinase